MTSDGSLPPAEIPSEQLTCDSAHEILSARLDGEASEAELGALELHLDGCVDCQLVGAELGRLDRQLRIRPALAVPDLRPVIMSGVKPAALGRYGWRRPALAWIALVLILQNAMALIGGQISGVEVHQARHLGAFGVALGIGLGFVAWRPHRAHGMLPFAGALIAMMPVSAAFDIIENGRNAISEVIHVSEIAGLVLVWMIAGSPGRPDRASLQRALSMVRSKVLIGPLAQD